MAEIDVRNPSGQAVGKVAVPSLLVDGDVNTTLMHQIVVAHLANRRQGTAATKTRAMVAGSGRKLFRQKGTGRARAGDLRSPTRVHGGTAHGPHPRTYRQRTPKKMRRLALLSALRDKFRSDAVVVIDAVPVAGQPRTREVAALLKTLDIDGRKTLLVLPDVDPIVYLSARNIPRLNVTTSALLHAYEVITHQVLVLLPASVSSLEARLGGNADADASDAEAS